MWHGYGKVIDNQGQTNYEAKSLTDLVDEFNATHTGVHVDARLHRRRTTTRSRS